MEVLLVIEIVNIVEKTSEICLLSMLKSRMPLLVNMNDGH
jgi:hypothetical protein